MMSEKMEGYFDVLRACLSNDNTGNYALDCLFDEVADIIDDRNRIANDAEHYQRYYERREAADERHQIARYGNY